MFKHIEMIKEMSKGKDTLITFEEHLKGILGFEVNGDNILKMCYNIEDPLYKEFKDKLGVMDYKIENAIRNGYIDSIEIAIKYLDHFQRVDTFSELWPKDSYVFNRSFHMYKNDSDETIYVFENHLTMNTPTPFLTTGLVKHLITEINYAISFNPLERGVTSKMIFKTEDGKEMEGIVFNCSTEIYDSLS